MTPALLLPCHCLLLILTCALSQAWRGILVQTQIMCKGTFLPPAGLAVYMSAAPLLMSRLLHVGNAVSALPWQCDDPDCEAPGALALP